MTRNVSATVAERPWSWWTNDAEHGFAGPNGKTPRLDVGVGGGGGGDDDDDGYWGDDSAAIASPLDLSMKATVTTAQRVQRVPDARPECGGNAHAAATPTKRKAAVRSPSKKAAAGKTAPAVGVRPSAIKAVTRRLLPQLMLDRTSPVSGTIITTMAGSTEADGCAEDDYDGDDIDPEYNIVVATDDARRRLESIPNVLGPYRCRLCGVRYADAFALARHRCRCIVHVRYRCPECDKVFQCPANLASHRRWHGTGTAGSAKTTAGGTNNNNNNNNNDNTNNNNNNDDGDGGDGDDDDDDASDPTVSVAAASVTTAAGFKKNMLQRAVQAAAAAAAARIDGDGACT